MKTDAMEIEEDIRFKIVIELLSAEATKGHLKWRVSDMARKLKVSRGLIYYHFGKTKQEIIDSCYSFIAEYYYGLSTNRELKTAEDLEKSIWHTLGLYLKNPSIAIFFHRWRLAESPIQKRIFKLETMYRERLQRLFPQLTHDEILAVHSIFNGAVTAPFANKESTRIVSQIVAQFLASRMKDDGSTLD